MKIAVTYENGNVFQHFGKTEAFKIYRVEDGKILNSEIVSTDGKGHGELVTFLNTNDVQILICGGIGAGAQTALSESGIKLYGGTAGNADEIVNAFLNGTLRYNSEVHCDHHDHEHDHSEHTCGSHGCGKHTK